MAIEIVNVPIDNDDFHVFFSIAMLNYQREGVLHDEFLEEPGESGGFE